MKSILIGTLMSVIATSAVAAEFSLLDINSVRSERLKSVAHLMNVLQRNSPSNTYDDHVSSDLIQIVPTFGESAELTVIELLFWRAEDSGTRSEIFGQRVLPSPITESAVNRGLFTENITLDSRTSQTNDEYLAMSAGTVYQITQLLRSGPIAFFTIVQDGSTFGNEWHEQGFLAIDRRTNEALYSYGLSAR